MHAMTTKYHCTCVDDKIRLRLQFFEMINKQSECSHW